MFCTKGALKNLVKFPRKPLCQSLLFYKVAAYKETLAQVFSCEYCEIFKNTFCYRTPALLCGKTRTKSLKSAKFKLQLFFTILDIMGSLYIVAKNCKTRYPQKNICGSVHSCWNSNFKTFKLKQKQFAVIRTQP